MKYFKKINITSKGQCLSIRLDFFEQKKTINQKILAFAFYPL